MAEEKIDPETQKVNDHNGQLLELVNHEGWKEARKMIVEKVLELQNVSEFMDVIQTGNATRLLREMKASARAAEIIFDWLRQVEGDAQTSAESKEPRKKGFMVKLNDDGTVQD